MKKIYCGGCGQGVLRPGEVHEFGVKGPLTWAIVITYRGRAVRRQVCQECQKGAVRSGTVLKLVMKYGYDVPVVAGSENVV